MKNKTEFKSIKDVIVILKKLYFYEELVTGEFYDLHLQRCKNYFLVNKLKNKKLTCTEIVKKIKLSHSTVYPYLNKRKPYLYLLASSVPDIKLKKGFRLLPLHSKKGGHAYHNYIKTPLKIKNYCDILNILKQLSKDQKREEAFAYILGIMISDLAKPKGYRFSNQCLLQLTRGYDWSLKIGEKFCKCLNLLGIKAHRIRDNDKYRKRAYNGEYRWISEKSPFIRYLLRTCIGMKKGQRTTYHKVNMDWILSTKREFLISFLQGICDGDGSAHSFWRIEISCDPNQEFILKLLKKLNLKGYIDKDAVSISNHHNIKKAYELPIFSCARGRMERLKKIKNMINSRVLIKEASEKIKKNIISLKEKGLSGGKISDLLFNRFNISLTPGSINRYYKKFEQKLNKQINTR